MSIPATPRSKTQFNPSTPSATPTTSRIAASSSTIQASPHYVTTRRHSLYGTEDRVIIDPGSRLWKVGFSGEGKPRDVFQAGLKSNTTSLWSLSRATDPAARVEEEKLLQVRLETCLRSVFHESLLTDPKSRKVILVEHPLLPVYIKEMIAGILFDNLQVPSISFASSHLLSLLAVGRITGLVLDCGHLESAALPIFAARPLFTQLRTTPLAGARLSSHLRALMLMFGTYLPPPTSLSAANIPAASRSTRVPEDVLTDAVIEEIKTRCCFVGEALDSDMQMEATLADPFSDASEFDLPPSSDAGMSESEFSQVGADSVMSSHHGGSSEFSAISHGWTPAAERAGESHLQAISTMYMRHSTATDLHMRVLPPPQQQIGTGRGTLIVPGWIRERAAEVLFMGGDVDESSVAEVILEALLKVPVDLRKTLASSILVIGGTLMLPGFIPRLHTELIRAIASPMSSSGRRQTRPDRPPPPAYDRYASLRPLVPYFAIINNPSPPPPTSERASANAGKAPAFSPATMAWVGGSLAGSLKTGGVEIPREKWDEGDPSRREEADDEPVIPTQNALLAPRNVLPDWTRMSLGSGAPPVVAAPLIVGV